MIREGRWRMDRVLPGVTGLAFLLVAGLWLASYFSPVARMKRATQKVVRLVEKNGEEAPVALGMAAHRLGTWLAADTVLELDGTGLLASGRQETVQLFAHIRAAMDTMTFAQPDIVATSVSRDDVRVIVKARYRFVSSGGTVEDDGTAVLVWRKGEEGWRIQRAMLTAGERTRIPRGVW